MSKSSDPSMLRVQGLGVSTIYYATEDRTNETNHQITVNQREKILQLVNFTAN